MTVPQLPLPIRQDIAIKRVILPALKLLPPAMTSLPAVLMILCIFLQESNLEHRWQVVDLKRPNAKGPARGLGQFERGTQASRGGVWGIMLHTASRFWLAKVCEALGIAFKADDIWRGMETSDALAVCASRLLLFTDPKPLPAIGDEEGAWRYYLRNWRPGAYTNGSAAARAALRAKWGRNYRMALSAAQAHYG
jgi:hypothetical protein